MKIADVVNQLIAVLPRYTNYFTDQLSVVSITSSGTTATVTTTNPHGLTTGDRVNIFGALVPNQITSLTSAGLIASAETVTKHDLIQNAANGLLGYPPNVEIIGADQTEYNGTHELLTSADRFKFTYQLGNPAISPATGTIYLLEDLKYGYNGLKTVTVINDTSFSYTIPQPLGSPAYGNIVIHTNHRISGAATIEKATQAYSKQQDGKLWTFVVMGDMTASKDRQANSDSIYTPGATDNYNQLVYQNVSANVFVPSTGNIAARAERDVSDDLIAPFCKSLLRLKLPPVFTTASYSGLVFASSNFGSYNDAVYIHQYVFEETAYITYEDTLDDSFGTAFRDIDYYQESEFNSTVIAEAKINLDNDA